MSKTTRPYGTWSSPITPVQIAGDTKLSDLAFDSDGRTLVWLEGRSGRGVLVCQGPGDDAPRELTRELDVRAQVGYGGGDFTVAGGSVFFAVKKRGALYRQSLSGGPARPITPSFGSPAAPAVSPDGRWVAYVHHDHGVDRLAVVDVEGRQWPRILHAGADFVMQPRWSPNGRHLTFVTWDLPHMPWEASTAWVAEVREHGDDLPSLGKPWVVAGGSECAAFQPDFGPNGDVVYVIDDEGGYFHLRMVELGSGERTTLTKGKVEYGLPAWAQGMRVWGLGHDGTYAVCTRISDGRSRLERLDLRGGSLRPLRGFDDGLDDYTDVEQVTLSPTAPQVAFIGSSSTTPPRVVLYDLDTERGRVVARASTESVPAAALSRAEAVTWTSGDGEQVYGLYYPPVSEHFEDPEHRPPLVVLVHGGPTSQVHAAWDPRTQFFTSRGYAVLCPNYRGSSGYGRAYWERLRGQWGVLDVDDAVSGQRALAARGLADGARCIIAGGSAGGYTVLQALVNEPEAFAAGLCWYGVADAFALTRDTHKFESGYNDFLFGALPESAAVYRERSPVFHADRIRRPVAIFQGDEDQVVPPSQSEAIVAALRRHGVPHIYRLYSGEGHGFRRADTLEDFYRSIETFLLDHVIYA